jgi:hypothetical protein
VQHKLQPVDCVFSKNFGLHMIENLISYNSSRRFGDDRKVDAIRA